METLMAENGNKPIQVSIENYTGVEPIRIIYREDNARLQLPLVPCKMPQAVNIQGTIEVPYEWMSKRDIRVAECHLTVNRGKGLINLTINETGRVTAYNPIEDGGILDINEFQPTSNVTGTIQMTDEFKKLHINEDAFWNPVKLAKYFRMNRHLFAKPEDAMVAVSLLKNVKAKITGDYQKQQELHGQISKTEFFQQEVSHNLPESIALKMSIFKGGAKEIYEVELDADIIDGEIMVQLVSPAVNEQKENACDTLINEQLSKIAALHPDLVIVEE